MLNGKNLPSHTEEGHIPGGGIIRELVFGANDGLVAAFAVVSGVDGAGVKSSVILIAGLAELIGGTISMAKRSREHGDRRSGGCRDFSSGKNICRLDTDSESANSSSSG